MLENKNYEDISISEICSIAKISRQAFYNNYNSKDDVINEIINNINKEFINKVNRPFENNNKEYYLKFFDLVKEYEYALKIIYSTNFKGKYLEITNKMILEKDDIKDELDKVKRLAWNGAMQNIIHNIVNNNIKLDNDILSDIMFNLFK